jgi:hypothetical protein
MRPFWQIRLKYTKNIHTALNQPKKAKITFGFFGLIQGGVNITNTVN